MDTRDKGMTQVPGGTELGTMRFHHATENDAQLKTCELFISGISQLVFQTEADHRQLNCRSKTEGKAGPLYLFLRVSFLNLPI